MIKLVDFNDHLFLDILNLVEECHNHQPIIKRKDFDAGRVILLIQDIILGLRDKTSYLKLAFIGDEMVGILASQKSMTFYDRSEIAWVEKIWYPKPGLLRVTKIKVMGELIDEFLSVTKERVYFSSPPGNTVIRKMLQARGLCETSVHYSKGVVEDVR